MHAEQFPFVPATLTARIDQVRGVAADPPAAQLQSVTFTLSDSTNLPIATNSANTADLWGRKLTLTFAPATSDDAAIIQSYGDLFDVIAGETHTEVLDPGNLPDSLVAQRIERLKVLTNSEAILSEQLYLVGLRYLQHADDGVAFAAGVRWQRAVKRTFEADVRRELRVEYNVAGAPLRLTPAENNIDVSRLAVGIVPINNDLTNRNEALALAGLQSSYLEGAIWEEMQQQQGISATKALRLSRMAGQALYTANASNIDPVLASVNLPDDVEDEIRGAVLQGRVAKFAASPITLNKWSGTGHILEDPATGAATYPISGGLAGGSRPFALAQCGAAVVRPQVQGDRFLPAIDGEEVGADGVDERRSPAPRFVAAARLLDFDHARAGIGEHLRAERAGEHSGEIGDQDAVERAAIRCNASQPFHPPMPLTASSLVRGYRNDAEARPDRRRDGDIRARIDRRRSDIPVRSCHGKAPSFMTSSLRL